EGNDLTAIFNEDNTSKLTVKAVDYTDTTLSTGLNLQDLAQAKGGAASLQLEGGKSSVTFVDASGDALSSGSLLSDATSLNVGDTLSLKVGSTAGSANAGGFVDIVIGANTTVQSLVDQVNNVAGVRAEFDEKTGSLSIIS
ncbi:flagellin hook IN motif-containing protein, partial [Pannonibacter sp. Pt2]